MDSNSLALMIPIVGVLAVFGVGALRVWATHREKLEQMKSERVERQAAIDRELLGLSHTNSPEHMSVILDRLTGMEERLARLEGGGSVQTTLRAASSDASQDADRHRSQLDEDRQTI